MMLRTHAQTAGVSLTAQQPYNNVVRTAIEALAAVLGGTQSLHTNALDEVLALPTEEAAAIALRTQQVIAHETGVANVIDPLGGSWFIESLTNRMEQRAEEYFTSIEKLGGGKGMLAGVLAGIDRGWFQQEIADASWREQLKLEKKRRVIVGFNEFVHADEPDLDTLRIDPGMEREQVGFLRDFRIARDADAVDKTLHALSEAARTSDNLIPLIVDAARASATEGEIIGAMREVFGEYRETPRF